MFTAKRTYTSPLAPELLQKELSEAFQPFESSSSYPVKDEQRPFVVSFEEGKWTLLPGDIEKGAERFRFSGEVQAQAEGSLFIFRAKPTKRQQWSLFKDSLYGLFLTGFTALMEVIQEIPLSIVLASVPLMLIFVGVYLNKSQKAILGYRWNQLDKNLEELAQPLST